MHPPINALVRLVGNADLGPGRLKGFDDVGRAKVRLVWTETDITVDANGGLERFEMCSGTPVALRGDVKGSLGVVAGYADKPEQGYWTYNVQSATTSKSKNRVIPVSEIELEPLPPIPSKPLDYLRALAWGSPEKILGRWKLRLIESRHIEDTGGIPALLGARISPMGHQIYAVRRVLWDRIPRFILADEVGLGKTVEAGLVIQALRAWNPALRVLVLAPGSMARQWQTELYLRFGALAFAYIDGATWSDVSSTEQKRLLARQNLIVTSTALHAIPGIRQNLRASAWDLVVIDEAHQYPPGSELYEFFHELGNAVHGLLVLSATPSKREMASLSGLLSLISPDIYKPNDTAALGRRIEKQRAVWDRLSLTRKTLDAARTEGKTLDREDLAFLASEWAGLIPDDAVVEHLLSQIKEGAAHAAEEIVAYVQEFHRLDHRIIRTRRSTLQKQRQHWSERRLLELAYEITNAEALVLNHLDSLPIAPDKSALVLRGLYRRMFSETPSRLLTFLRARRATLRESSAPKPSADLLALLIADPSPADEEIIIETAARSSLALSGELEWVEEAIGLVEEWKANESVCARVSTLGQWLRDFLRESDRRQVLIFAQDHLVVRELLTVLGSMLGAAVPIKAFHHGIKEEELARIALDFQRNRGCRVLICDELGGEGRNFQNADALVHFDLPWSVARIEQRIGRLDRVGRGADRPVTSVLCCHSIATEDALRRIHRDAFKVFTRSVGGLEYALPKLQARVNEAICDSSEVLRDLKDELEVLIDREIGDADEAFNLSLDASKVQLRDAQELAQLLDEPRDPHSEGVAFAKWANHLGINSHKRGPTWQFQWDGDSLNRPLEGLPTSGLIEGMFDRQRALRDDSEQFLGPGHPLVDAIFRDLAEAHEGRATVIGAQLGETYTGRMFALILGRCRRSETDSAKATISPGLSLRATQYLWPQIEPVLIELRPGQEIQASAVKDVRLTSIFRRPDAITVPYKEIPANMLGASIDSAELWVAVEVALSLGVRLIAQRRAGIAEAAAASMKEDLEAELGFLRWQRANSDAKHRKRIDQELAAREALIHSMQHELVEPEAIAIIIGVK